MSGKIVMIGSMKGGVSKTVTTFNLAYSLSKLGKKVLAVDFDSQANLSTCLGVENVTAVPVTIGNLMLAQIEEEELPERSEYIQTRNGVDYISSSMVLSAVDAKLRLEMGSEKMLSDILETLRDSYDYILIDTSPSLGALTINAMSAADEVLITVNPQLLAMMGLQDFLKTVKKIKNRINSRLCDTLVTVAVESIKIDGSSTVNTGIYFGSLKDRLSVCIHDTRSSSTIRVDEVASLVSLIIRSFKITITKRCLKYRECRYGLAVAFKLGLTFLICCLDSCLDFLNSSGIRLWNDEGDTVLRCSTID